MKTIIKNSIIESLDIREKLLDLIPVIEDACNIIKDRISNGGKLLILGNGGSAADAQHIAAEMVGRFEYDHAPIPALALTTNSSIITAVSNDFGYDDVFSRQMESLLKKEDVVLAISTSGSSENIIKAINKAKQVNVPVIGLTGKDGGDFKKVCDLCIIVPSDRTCRIQEMHITIGHILCEIIEIYWMKGVFNNERS